MATRFDFVWLASQSPRRAQLLQQIGVEFRRLSPDAGEDVDALEAERAGELPAEYVQRVTRAKLDAALARQRRRGAQPAPILCAMLQALSARTHRVLTAVALHDGAGVRAALSVSRVRFAALPLAVIDAYVAGGEPFGKAGAYAIQGAIAGWIEHIEGSHSGIMGLPLFETATLLRGAGVALA